MKKVQTPDEKPEMFYQPKATPIGLPPKMRCIQKPAMVQPQQKVQQLPSDDFFHRNVQQFGEQCHRNNPFLGSGDITMSTTMPAEFMNQMMNCSIQPRFHPSNPFEEASQSNQSFYERNLMFQQQQQYQAMKRDFYNSAGFSTGGSSVSSSSSRLMKLICSNSTQ